MLHYTHHDKLVQLKSVLSYRLSYIYKKKEVFVDKQMDLIENGKNGPSCSDVLELPKMGKPPINYPENDLPRKVSKTNGAVAHMERMQNSAFWLFLWNDVYANDETEAKVKRKQAEAAQELLSGQTKSISTLRGCKSDAVAVPAPILDNAVTRTMMTDFQNIKIALISKKDCFPVEKNGDVKCDKNLVFQNGMPTEWTVERCKTFQKILTLDCAKNDRMSRPFVVPVQHLILKLPVDFKPGLYSIGVVGCGKKLERTTGMYFTARDVDAEHVFEADVLDHYGADWMWDEMDETSNIADVHSFHQLYNGRFLCEKEPGKAIDVDEKTANEFGRHTVWIGMPPGRAGSQETRSTDLVGDFGGSVPTGHASYRYQKERVAKGYIAAIGMELQTHDNQGVMVFTEKQCAVCLEIPLDLVMLSVGACNHRVLCTECADMLNQKLMPCPICRAPNVLTDQQ